MRKAHLVSAALLLLACGAVFGSGGTESAATATAAPVTIDWFVNEGWFNRPWDVEKTMVDKIITDKTGVMVNFTNSAGGGTGTEKLTAMIAADNLTDVVTMGWWYTQFQDLEAAGYLQALDAIMPKMAPGLWARTSKAMRNWYTFSDGHWYGFANFFWDPEQFGPGNYMTSNGGLVVREDLMNKVGLKASDFSTQEGFFAALKRVKDAGLTYNGLKIAPLYFTPNGGFPGTWVWDGFYAVPREDAQGKYLDVRLTKEFHDYMKFANRLFREGIISIENYTSDRNQISEKIVSGQVFALACNMADYMDPWKKLLRLDPAARMIPVGPPLAAGQATPTFNSAGYTGWLVSAVSHTSKKTEAVMRLWDLLYGDDGLKLSIWGVEGKTFTMANGKVQWTDYYLNLLNTDPDSIPTVVGNSNLWLLHNPVIEQRIKPPPVTDGEKMEEALKQYFAKYTFNDSAFGNTNPLGGTDEAAMYAEITTYWEEQLPKIVLATSEAQFEAIFQEGIRHIKELGLDKVLAVQDRLFQANKQKLKISRSWPTAR